jgi:RsiW-degrading membrane proteinase PrsW (M82 family)
MMNVLLIAGAVLPAIVVLWYCICSLNEMTAASPHGPRAAVVLIAGGVFAQLLSVALGTLPEINDLFMLAGLAVLVRTNCKRGICPCVQLPSWPDRRSTPR